jgi:hypothetical protein
VTYEEVLAFFVRNQKEAPPGSVGGLLRKAEKDGWLVRLFFLDSNGDVIPAKHAPGRAYLARQLDDELSEILGEKDLAIFSP